MMVEMKVALTVASRVYLLEQILVQVKGMESD
jgi:hypothetical protein